TRQCSARVNSLRLSEQVRLSAFYNLAQPGAVPVVLVLESQLARMPACANSARRGGRHNVPCSMRELECCTVQSPDEAVQLARMKTKCVRRDMKLQLDSRNTGVAVFVGIEFEFYRLRDRFNLAPQPQRIWLLGACDE